MWLWSLWSLLPSYETPMLCQDPPPNLQRGLTCTEDPCDSHPSVDVNWLQNECKGGTATGYEFNLQLMPLDHSVNTATHYVGKKLDYPRSSATTTAQKWQNSAKVI